MLIPWRVDLHGWSYALRMQVVVLGKGLNRLNPIRSGWDWNPKNPIRSGGVWILRDVQVYIHA